MPDQQSRKAAQYFPFNLPEYKSPRIDLWKHIDPNNLNVLISCFQVDSGAKPVELSGIEPLGDKTRSLKRAPEVKKPSPSLRDLDQYKLFSGLITKLFSLKPANKRDQILVDNYYYLFKFALSNDFNAVQISSLLSLMIRTHELAMETSFGNLDETFDCFKKILLGYSVHRPPFSLAIFTAQEAEKIIAYFFNSYFKQFKLYKYIYTPTVKLSLQFKYTNMPKEEVEASKDPSKLSNASKSEYTAEGELTDSTRTTLNPNGQLVDSANNMAQDELKEFIRQYLNQRVDKMKSELDEELKKTASELGLKVPASNAKRQQSSGKRTGK